MYFYRAYFNQNNMKKNSADLLKFLSAFVISLCSFSAFAQPANNECAGAIGMTMNPNGSCAATTAVVTTGATLSTPVLAGGGVFCAPTSGNDDVWYTFSTGATQSATILTVTNIVATSGTATNIGYAVYTGTCASLTQAVCTASGVTTTANISVTASTNYYLRVWAGGGANSATFTLCLQDGPPPPNCATGLSPANGATPTLLCGPNPSSIIFTWTAPSTGPAPTGYKFYLGAPTPALLGTVTTATANVFNLLPNTVYNWYVVPTNGSDAAGCNTPLTFTTGPEPACSVPNNSCSSATAIGAPGNPGTVNSTTTGSTISQAGELCAGFTGIADDDVWFSFTTDNDGGDVTIALTNAAAALDAVIQVYSGTCGSLVNIGCADAGASGGLNETAVVTGLAANTTYYVRVYGYGAFSATVPTSGTFTLTTSGNGVTGIVATQLLNPRATVQNANALISWQTAQEQNNKGFEILKSFDGNNFTGIGFVNSAGNSSAITNYSFTDVKPRTGIMIYYRVKQIDNNGISKVSTIVSAKIGKEGTATAFVYPNPAKSVVNVTFNDPLSSTTTISITDARGQLLLSFKANRGDVSVPVNISKLSNGIYFINILNNERTERLQLVKSDL